MSQKKNEQNMTTEELQRAIQERDALIRDLYSSYSWRITAPLRYLLDIGFKLRRSVPKRPRIKPSPVVGHSPPSSQLSPEEIHTKSRALNSIISKGIEEDFVLPGKQTDELLVYLDPGFFSDWGHYKNFSARIHSECNSRSIDLWHFTSVDVTDEDAERFSLNRVYKHRAMLPQGAGFIRSEDVTPEFLLSDYLDAGKLDDNTAEIVSAFICTTKKILDELVRSRYDKVSIYMYTAHPLHVGLLSELLAIKEYSHLNVSLHTNIFYLNLDFCRGSEDSNYINLLSVVSNTLRRSGRSHIYADSSRTIELYRRFFGNLLHLSPIPFYSNLTALPGSTKVPGKQITIGYFGFSHEKQGYPLVKALYDHITTNCSYPDIHFVVRHNLKFTTKIMKDLSAHFQTSNGNIEHITETFITDEDYYNYFGRCDIVLVPHSAAEYPCQSSGQLTDALLRGKIVVVSENTWLSDQLERFGAGESFDSYNPDSFITAVLKVIDNVDEYRSRAMHNIAEFRSFHSIHCLFNMMSVGTKDNLVEVTTDSLPTRHLRDNQRLEVSAYSNQLLSRFKGKHKGQRCVIIGNGPSLAKMDLSFLKDEITFGTNRIYLGFDKWGFSPTYYVTVNTLVIKQSNDEIAKIPCPKFVSIYGFPYLENYTDYIYLQPQWGPFFARDVRNGICEGHTVTYVAMQLAYFMGFDEVVLIGVDHNFVTQGDPNKEIVSGGADPNHFHPDYFGKGIHWQLPDLPNSEVAYKLAKYNYTAEDKRIIDATYNGKLDIFPKIDYRDFFIDKRDDLAIPEVEESLPLVSIILSRKGNVPFLRRSLESISKQIYKNLEVIVAGDPEEAPGSENLKIKYVPCQKNAARADLLNLSIDAASGDYIAYLDEGDVYLPDHISGLVSYFIAHPESEACFVRAKEIFTAMMSSASMELSRISLNTTGFDKNDLLVNNFIFPSTLFHRKGLCDGSISRLSFANNNLFSNWRFILDLISCHDLVSLPVESVETYWESNTNYSIDEPAQFIDAYKCLYDKYNSDSNKKILEKRESFLNGVNADFIFTENVGLRAMPPAAISVVHRLMAEMNANPEDFSTRLFPFISGFKPYLAQIGCCSATVEDISPRTDKPALIVTSISPFDFQKQKRAVNSWLRAGFTVASLNCREEIEVIRKDYPGVEFKEVTRDARELTGKPLVYFDDALDFIAEKNIGVSGIVNSDIILDVDEDFIDYLTAELKNADMVIGSRVDIPSAGFPHGTTYPIGFDYFFFSPAVAALYPREEFGFGMPWWDYWAPYVPMSKGITVKQIVPPVGYHIKHEFKWNRDVYAKLGARFCDWLAEVDSSLELDERIINIHGKNHALFLSVLKYVHDNTEKISYVSRIRKQREIAVDIDVINSRIKHLEGLTLDLPRKVRTQIFLDYLKDAARLYPCFSIYLTLCSLHRDLSDADTAQKWILDAGYNALKRKDLAVSANLFEMYKNEFARY